jgi:PfpI family intracellular protease
VDTVSSNPTTLNPLDHGNPRNAQKLRKLPSTKVPLTQRIVPSIYKNSQVFKTYRQFCNSLTFKEVRPEEFDGLIIPGGRAPEYIRTYPELEAIVRHFFEKGKPVAAICHGPLVLAAYGLLTGRRVTAYAAVAPDVVRAGAVYVDREVVVDGNLVTSRAWPDLPAFMREFIKLLKSR